MKVKLNAIKIKFIILNLKYTVIYAMYSGNNALRQPLSQMAHASRLVLLCPAAPSARAKNQNENKHCCMPGT